MTAQYIKAVRCVVTTLTRKDTDAEMLMKMDVTMVKLILMDTDA